MRASHKAFGYPIVPALYIVGAAVILCVPLCHQTATSWPGLAIVVCLSGVPAHFLGENRGDELSGSRYPVAKPKSKPMNLLRHAKA